MRCSSRSPACLLALAAGVVLALVLATRALDRAPVATSTIDPITDASSPKPRAAESGVRGADPLATPKPRSGEGGSGPRTLFQLHAGGFPAPVVTRRRPGSVSATAPPSRPQTESTPEPSIVSEGPVGAARPSEGITPGPGDNPIPHIMICHPDARGAFGAADVLQECIDRAPAYSSVEIPPGIYVLYRHVVVSTPLTIRTAGSANSSLSCVAGSDQCAVLIAGPDFFDPDGVLVIRSTNNVTLEHLVLDGNRQGRLSSAAARLCEHGQTAFGFNAAVLECVSCGLDDVVSQNALCGTGMVWSGANALIQRSAFRANGDSTRRGMWADGLTLVYAPESDVRQNQFVDNSDIGLIVGYGVRSRVERNIVLQRTQSAFAGLMLDNFNSDNLRFRGDFRGAVIAGNTIDCGPQLCVFGIQIGPRPWYPTQNIVGGEVHGNEVRGAKVGINVDGAGVNRAPIAIFANSVSDVPAHAYFSGCATPITTDWMNVAPTSVVDRRDDLAPAGAHLSDPCQFWSGLAPDQP